MSVTSHLRELRKRVILILLGLFIGTIAGWFLTMPVLEFIQRPLLEITNADPQLNFQTIGAAFDLRLRVSFWTATLVTSPWWILQIGLFVWPGLKRSERLHALGFGVAGVVLFGAGVFAGIKVIPTAIEILVSFMPKDAQMLLRADSYLSFYMTLVFAFGLSFLLPEILVALNFAGLLSSKTMLKGWRWAVIGSFVIAAIINPIPNPIPMILQSMGLITLYFLAILISRSREKIVAKQKARELLAEEAGEAPGPASADAAIDLASAIDLTASSPAATPSPQPEAPANPAATPSPQPEAPADQTPKSSE